MLWQNFDSNFAHPAHAKRQNDFIRPELLTRRQRHNRGL